MSKRRTCLTREPAENPVLSVTAYPKDLGPSRLPRTSCQFLAQGRRTFRTAENLAKRTPIKPIALGKALGQEAFPERKRSAPWPNLASSRAGGPVFVRWANICAGSSSLPHYASK